MINKSDYRIIEKLIKKSNFDVDLNLINFMEISFLEIEKMIFTFLQSEFIVKDDQNLFLNKVFFTLKEIAEINNIRKEYLLESDETKAIEKNCFLKNNKVVYRKP